MIDLEQYDAACDERSYGDPPPPLMVFMMGMPAAGKSTVAARMFPTFTRIDTDEFKKTLDGYDPKNPQPTHAASKVLFERAFQGAIASGAGEYVIDGTGVNAEAMVRRIVQAQSCGFAARLVYVTCSLATSLHRNAARERNVCEEIVREKAANIATSFEIVSRYADSVEVIAND
jgi:predicted kinase